MHAIHGLQWPTHRQSFTGVSTGTDLAVVRDHTECVAPPRFVVQLRDATRLHYDFRLQVGDVLRSWAVPRGPSLDPAERRLAVQVEDHSLAAGEFEGVHRGQARGSGAVIIWDEGTLRLLRNERDHLSFELDGYKLHGRFGLSHARGRQWILVKALDDEARRDRHHRRAARSGAKPVTFALRSSSTPSLRGRPPQPVSRRAGHSDDQERWLRTEAAGQCAVARPGKRSLPAAMVGRVSRLEGPALWPKPLLLLKPQPQPTPIA